MNDHSQDTTGAAARQEGTGGLRIYRDEYQRLLWHHVRGDDGVITYEAVKHGYKARIDCDPDEGPYMLIVYGPPAREDSDPFFDMCDLSGTLASAKRRAAAIIREHRNALAAARNDTERG